MARRQAIQDGRRHPERVTVVSYCGAAGISPPVAAVADALTVERMRPVTVSGGELRVERLVERMYEIKRGRMWFHYGHWARVERILRKNGFKLRVLNRRPPSKHFEPIPILNDEHPLPDLHCQIEHAAFVIDYHKRLAKLSAICRSFPTALITVVCATRRETKFLCRRLRQAHPESIGFSVGVQGIRYIHSRIIVGTPDALSMLQAGGHRILVRAEADKLFHDKSFIAIRKVYRWAVGCYGFLTPGWRPGNAERLRSEAFCGEQIAEAGRIAGTCIRVMFVPSGGIRVRRSTTPRERREIANSLNAARSKRAAELALAFKRNPRAQVARLAHFALDDSRLERVGAIGSVAVVCGAAAQAAMIAEHLPGWRRLDGRSTTGLCPIEDAEGGDVVTVLWAARNPLAADAVVYAVGGQGTLASLKGGEALTTTKLLVDFDDRFDEAARTDSRHRKAEYERAGWPIS